MNQLMQIPPAMFYFAAALPVMLFKGKARGYYSVAVAIAAFAYVLMLPKQTSLQFVFSYFQMTLLRVDRISLFIGYIFAFMAIVIAVYSMHVEDSGHHVFALIYVGSAMGMVFAGDLVSFYLFGETMMLASTALICYTKDKKAVKSGFRYLMMHLFGGTLLLAGILLHYLETGSMEITSMQTGIPALLILAGVGVNAAFIPFHTWLPDAYSKAPFTASLLLSVFTTKTAVYALARMFPGVEIIAYMGAAMAVFGVALALLQSDARKLLSYHVISQVGFMVAGVGMGTFLGVDGGLYHAWNHILYKSLLFMCIGAVIYRTGKQDLTELGGFAWSMPITTVCSVIAALSISGVPLFNGYASKAILYEAAYGSDLLSWMLKIASFGTLLSFCKFTYYGFLRPRKVVEVKDGHSEHETHYAAIQNSGVKEAPLHMTIPMTIVAMLCVLGGIYPRLIALVLPYNTDLPVYLPAKVGNAVLITVIAGIIFFIAAKKLVLLHKRDVSDVDPLSIRLFRKYISGRGKLEAQEAALIDSNAVGSSVFLVALALALFLTFLLIEKI